jgi:hypothetical protein
MSNYLEPTDPGAFIDYPLKDSAEAAEMGFSHECPLCKGHGGWNLRVNAYPLHNKEDSPENRHNFSHFKAHCDTCHGWGYVREKDANHIHKWEFVRNTGNCLNLYHCSGCSKDWEVDSSG